MLEEVELVVVGAGPAGSTAAREAARGGASAVVLEKDAVVGSKRVCAAGLRPGFCETFDLPRTLVHCDTPRLALFDVAGVEREVFFGPGHTTTREELDGEIARQAVRAGAQIRTGMLYRGFTRDGDRTIVEYADAEAGSRRRISARNLFLAQGATAQLEAKAPLGFDGWQRGLMTTLQYRVYLDAPAAAIAYQTLELHYYPGRDGRQIIGWMFPKRDHLAIGLGFTGKMPGAQLRWELESFTQRVRARLYPGVGFTLKQEGHLLYGGMPRPHVACEGVMVGGTAAGLVDATNGEGIFEAAMSGRLAAEAVASSRERPQHAAARYGRALRDRFHGRLRNRERLMRFLERKPARYGLLFEQLAGSARFADVLQREDRERGLGDRAFLYGQALKFALRCANA
ncbi:MAG TPA: NAD(P)/FAD-dependent oxidoreductase [Candidatus Baltobacteraceae bacterium]